MPRDRVSLYLLRHGETERHNCLYGHLDLALSARGQAQARAQAQALKDIVLAQVASSDLERARIGAREVIAAQATPPNWQQTPRLREMNMGEAEGMGYAEARAAFPILEGKGYGDLLEVRLPGGESARDVYNRARTWLAEFIREHAGQGPQNLAIVAHNAVNRLILAHCATGKPDCYGRFDQHTGCINRIDFEVRDPGQPLSRATIVYTNLHGNMPALTANES